MQDRKLRNGSPMSFWSHFLPTYDLGNFKDDKNPTQLSPFLLTNERSLQ